MDVNSDFLDPAQGKFGLHYARPVRLIFDRNYYAKVVSVLLFRVCALLL
jgi:hypothetical protein